MTHSKNDDTTSRHVCRLIRAYEAMNNQCSSVLKNNRFRILSMDFLGEYFIRLLEKYTLGRYFILILNLGRKRFNINSLVILIRLRIT